MGRDWIPDQDGEFNRLFSVFNAFVAGQGTARGLSAGEVADCASAFARWSGDYAAHLAAQTAAQAARQSKDDARGAADPVLRALARKLQANPALTDGERAEAGLTVPDGTRTAAAVPVSRPRARVDTGQRLRHTVHFKDEPAAYSRRKPKGVMGAEIWCAVGARPPADPAACRFVALQTRTPCVVDYDGTEAGQTAHYLLRWVSTRGAKGPWSETVSATIGA